MVDVFGVIMVTSGTRVLLMVLAATSPVSGLELPSLKLVPLVALKRVMEDYSLADDGSHHLHEHVLR